MQLLISWSLQTTNFSIYNIARDKERNGRKSHEEKEMKVQHDHLLGWKKHWALEAIIVTYLSFIWIVSTDASGLVLLRKESSNVTPSATSIVHPEVVLVSSLERQEDSWSSVKIPSPSSSSIVASSYITEVTSPPSDLILTGNESPFPSQSPRPDSSTVGEEVRSFKGYSVLRLTPTTTDQLNFLRQLQSNDSKVSDVCLASFDCLP